MNGQFDCNVFLFFFLGMSTVDSVFTIVIFHICMSLFESTLLSFCKALSKLYLPIFICSVAFFLSLLPWRSVGRSNFDWGLQKLSYVDSNNDIQIWKITIYIYIYIYIVTIASQTMQSKKAVGFTGLLTHL